MTDIEVLIEHQRTSVDAARQLHLVLMAALGEVDVMAASRSPRYICRRWIYRLIASGMSLQVSTAYTNLKQAESILEFLERT